NSGRQIDCEALIWLHQRVPEKRRVRVYELPANTAASVLHQGKDETIEQTYRVARRWIKAQGYQMTEPNLEIYWPDAQAGASSLTEIQFHVFITPKPTSAGGYLGQPLMRPEIKKMSQPTANVRFINRAPLGFSHVVEARGGRTLYIAGQLPLDKEG